MSGHAPTKLGVALIVGAASLVPSACLHAKAINVTAMPGRPAVIEVEVTPATRTAPEHARAFARLAVTAFTQPKTGGVEAIVTMRRNGNAPKQAVDHLGLFPAKSFSVSKGDEPQQFLINLRSQCRDIRADGAPLLEVALVPVNGEGTGASLTLGRTTLECL